MKRVTTAPPLTADQLRLAKIFAGMDADTQRAMLMMMESMAEADPRRVRPKLRLVGGGK